MAPTKTNFEPRYNGFDLHRNQITNGHNGSLSNSSNIVSQRIDDQNNTNGIIHNYSDTFLQSDMAAHLDPPQGFEPCPQSTSPDLNATIQDSDDKSQRPGSRTSSRVSNNSSTSSIPPPLDQVDTHINETHETCTRNDQDNINPGHSSSTSSTNSTIRSQRSNSNQEPPSSSSTNDDNNKSPEPTTSTSGFRMINGINTIVTKLAKAFTNSSFSIISTDRCLQDDMPKFAFGHKRSLEKTWKLMDKVVKCCQRPQMNLNNSPPFILEILPETYQHLKLIHTKYDSNRSSPPNDNDYSQILLKNLQNRCKQTLKLFKDAKEEMFNVGSEYRQKLTRNTLVFNHILSELKAIFPHGQFIDDKYLITKKESAGEFWRCSFGTSVLVDWKTFYHALQQVHNIDSSFFSLHALKQTIDLTCDDFISIFEFDVFTRLFQPWSTLLRNWQILAVTHPGYKAFLTYDELKSRLQKYIDKPGSYVYRLSCTKLGQWAIGYVTPDGQILQTIVQNISLSQALTETKFYLYPDGKDEDPSLSVLCSGMSGDERNVTVTEEQYEIYCGVGNSFQTCKICFENDKDIRLEPCNHLLCTSCLIAWQESEGQGCPYCRTEIKETVQITMDLPRSTETRQK